VYEMCGDRPVCSCYRRGSILDGDGTYWASRSGAAPQPKPDGQPTLAPQSAAGMEAVPDPMTEESPTVQEPRLSRVNRSHYSGTVENAMQNEQIPRKLEPPASEMARTCPCESEATVDSADESLEGPELWIAQPRGVQRR
jgi:hypothetical protein